MTRGERHQPERIIAFSDAVVAIAITVLLLPLAGLDTEDGDVLGLLGANSQLLWGLTLTWVIIAVFWFAHHRLFDRIEAVDRVVLWLNFGWLFAIALLPLPTNIVVRNEPGPQVTGFYIGWMAVISLLMSVILWYARRTPGLMVNGSSLQARTAQVRTSVISGIFVIAFAAALVFPDWATYLLLLMFFADPLAERLVKRAATP
jgi:uncharacterized membrane protein